MEFSVKTATKTYVLFVGLLVGNAYVYIAADGVLLGLLFCAVIYVPYLVIAIGVARSCVRVDAGGHVWVQQWGRSVKVGRVGEVRVISRNFHPLWKGRPAVRGPSGSVRSVALWEAPFFDDEGREGFVRLLVHGPEGSAGIEGV